MITEVIQANELSHMQQTEKQKNVKTFMHTYICLRIFNNRQQKTVLLIVHNSQRQTKNNIRTLLTFLKILIPVVYFIFPQNNLGQNNPFPITFKYFLISFCYVKCQNILVNVLVHLLQLLSQVFGLDALAFCYQNLLHN